jgi:hypothetical protein
MASGRNKSDGDHAGVWRPFRSEPNGVVVVRTISGAGTGTGGVVEGGPDLLPTLSHLSSSRTACLLLLESAAVPRLRATHASLVVTVVAAAADSRTPQTDVPGPARQASWRACGHARPRGEAPDARGGDNTVIPTIVGRYGCWHAGNIHCFATYLRATTHEGQVLGLYPLAFMVTARLQDRPTWSTVACFGTTQRGSSGPFTKRSRIGWSAGPCDETNPLSRHRTDANRGGGGGRNRSAGRVNPSVLSCSALEGCL